MLIGKNESGVDCSNSGSSLNLYLLKIQSSTIAYHASTLFSFGRFSGTLQDYIRHKDELPVNTSLALLAQLLEGVLHLKNNGIANRDLKADNILVNDIASEMPHLVITDFDCCLAEKHLGLQLPYETDETCKGGNPELMAPEVYSIHSDFIYVCLNELKKLYLVSYY